MITQESIIAGCNNQYPNATLCLKRPLYVLIITAKNEYFYGMNCINNSDLKECPRQNSPTGEGYELCRNVCRQGAHAELHAITACLDAQANLHGAKAYLTGHDYCCESCLLHMKQYGITSAYCLDSNKTYTL